MRFEKASLAAKPTVIPTIPNDVSKPVATDPTERHMATQTGEHDTQTWLADTFDAPAEGPEADSSDWIDILLIADPDPAAPRSD